MIKAISIKGISIGILTAAILLLICYGLADIGAGPCNAGIGVFYSFFIIIASLAIAVLLISNKSRVISMAAKTVAAIILLAIFAFYYVLNN